MKAAIIDDEVHCIESLMISLNELFPEIKIVYKSSNVSEALERIPKLGLDLLFLDIEMPGMNGFQLLENFSERSFDVIFTTAYSQYAIKAFKAKAINYLLKPIDDDELKVAIENWKKKREEKKEAENQNIDELLDHLKKSGFMNSKISVPVIDGYNFVEVNEIIYCQGKSNYTNLIMKNDTELLVSKSLKYVENALKNFFFLRIHQSFLVNPNYLVKYSRNDGGYVTMANGDNISVSNQKRHLIINLFDSISDSDE